jgi:periodic tryptophan protein 2
LNSKDFVDFSDSDFEERKDKSLPGSKNFDISKRKMKLRVETRMIKFSPSEDSFIVATSEGLFIFS